MRLAIVGAFLGLSAFGWLIPFETRAAANEDLLVKDVTTPDVTDRIPDWATHLDDSGAGVRFDTKVTIPSVTDRISDGATRVGDPGSALFGTKATLKLADGGVLEFRYSPIGDTGVQLRRLNRQGSILWGQYCDGLGVMHSEYFQDVFVFVEGDTLRVVSWGSRGEFVERLALNSGKRLSRSIDCDSYGDPPRCVPYYPFPGK
jgi:hypothetical protein